MSNDITLYIISDSIGETGELIGRAAIRQFISEKYEIRRYPYVSREEQIREIFDEANQGVSIILYTTVQINIANYINQKGLEYNIPTIDIMSEPLMAIENLLGIAPRREAGLIRRLDENYFKKVEAVEFAVKYDDGKDARGVKKADICLVGISRTSKTPLSMYLAHKNYKVANVPLVPEVSAPNEIFEKDIRRVIGLVADPVKLNEIRKIRLKALGLSDNANYANVDRINKELEYSKEIMKKLGCVVIDVSNSAIEETASIIIDHMKKNFGQ
jgi:regulator of PEP synthase PpsR (kinase-PPPase family)